MDDIYPQLRAQAELLVRRSGSRRRFDQNRESVADDLLHEAVARAWDGRRCWNPDKVDLWGFLVGVMKSLIYEEAHSPENKTSSLDEPVGEGENSGSKVEMVEHDSPTPEELHIDEEQSNALEAALFEAAGDDPVLLKFLQAVMDGAGSPAEIAKQTGWTAAAVYQAHRKLVRRVTARRAEELSQ